MFDPEIVLEALRDGEETFDLVSSRGADHTTGSKTPVDKLYIDATGLLASGGLAPTGIPRVQAFLVEQAIRDPDPRVKAVTFDKTGSVYRDLSEFEEGMLTSVSPAWPDDESRQALFRAAARMVRENPELGKEFDRIAAARIAKARPPDLSYAFTKLLLRAYRLHQQILSRRHADRRSAAVARDVTDGVVLMSHSALFGSRFNASVAATASRAFICHDLIPWSHPEFVGDRRQAKRFVDQLTYLVRSGAHALCLSEATRTVLSQFAAKAGNRAMKIDKVPMPSTLHETTRPEGDAARMQPDEPYVLYCSTVEVRKNHLLLAKIWKRSLDEGVALPRLLCIGKWGWGTGELRKYLDDNPELLNRISFVGPVADDELVRYYRGAHFGVMPSFIEGWGLGASECLDFGVPVVVSTAPGLVEATHGLMPAIDPDDELAWYATIRRLAENDAARGRLSASIEQHYRPGASRESWNAIKAALAGSPASESADVTLRPR